MIIDAHAHIARNDYSGVELYLQQLQESGVDGGLTVPGGMIDVRRITDYIIGRTQPGTAPPDNGYVQNAVQAYPQRIAALCCVNPKDPEALQTLDNALRQGSRGLKLSPMSHMFSFASKAVADLVALCAHYEAPVYTHTLYNPGASTERFVSLAKQFPQVNFVLGHMGFGPADQDGLQAAVELDNFFLETSTGNTLHIEQAVRRAGATKVLYGSEFPLSHPKVELEKILVLKLPQTAQEQVLGKNALHLFKLDALGDTLGR